MQQNSPTLCNGEFNTLAQSATSSPPLPGIKRAKVVHGNGTNVRDKEMIQHRARRKFITNIISRELADIAIQKGNTELARSFWNSYYCLDSYIESNGKAYANYCKNRHCTVCAAIRKAEIVNKYLPIIRQWPDPHFVTLTVKSLGAVRLRPLMDSVNKGMNGIIRQYAKRYERGTGPKLVGIKSLECNFNPKARTYNPHFHLIVATKEMAEIFVKEWLQKSRLGKTHYKCQDMSPMTNGQKCLLEVIKYSSKIFTQPDPANKKRNAGKKIERKVYVHALYEIIEAMKGRRLFGKFGFSLSKESQSKLARTTELTSYNEFYYHFKRSDWFDSNGDLPLTEFKPDSDLLDLLGKLDRDLN